MFDLSYLAFWNGSKNFYTDLKTLANFNTTPSHVEEYKANDFEKINGIVSALNANNDTVSAIRLTYEKHVIRTKLNIQSYAKKKKFNKQFEENLKEWSKKGNCELTGRFYRGSAERALVSENEVLSGGFILRHHYDKRFIMGYKFEIIPLHAIDRTKTNFIYGLYNGIQTNRRGEITEIHIYTDQTKTESKPVPYKHLTLSVKIWLDVTQYSGVSPIAPMLASLDLLQEYTLEEMKGAKTRAQNNFIIKTHFYSEMKKIAQANKELTSTELAELYSKFKLDNGDVTGAKYIPSEDDVVELGKSTQSVYDPLNINTKRGMSVGVGLSPMSTSGEMPSSYNSTLYFAQQEEGTYEISLENFVENSWREVIEVKLMNGMVMVGKLKAEGYWLNPSKFRKVNFIRASSDHIDPSKVQKARSEGIANKTKNIIDVLASDGVDYQDHIDKEVSYELARKEAFEKAGLAYIQTNVVPPKEESTKKTGEEE